ncbi:hypothetical protein BH789_gp054 [Gordonia phage GMA6]|uniref:Uncharacterized protein n=1 Tax=Gordonia phage GMA6 TaxID=1647285 RepID=A0A0K0NKS7_9CAUD|nr:hypothetical protein BH789_gp054 [Gordonia phage GMA6]AKL88335.1 hypothetical protein GMA6_54 [Gordonia phage GMA6]
MAAAKKKPTPRKRSAPATKKTTTARKATPAKRAPANKKATTTKATTRKPAAKKTAQTYEPHPIEYTDEGFQVGTDSAIIATTLVTGASDRAEINALAEKEIKKVNGLTTRTGKDKYTPSMVSSILSRMLATGEYEVQASWQLVKVEKKTRGRKKK